MEVSKICVGTLHSLDLQHDFFFYPLGLEELCHQVLVLTEVYCRAREMS